MGHHPANDVPAEDIEHDVQLKVGPLPRRQSAGVLPSLSLRWSTFRSTMRPSLALFMSVSPRSVSSLIFRGAPVARSLEQSKRGSTTHRSYEPSGEVPSCDWVELRSLKPA